MSGINRVTLGGRFGTDVVLRQTQTGLPVANFRIAVDRPVDPTQAAAAGQQSVDFFTIVAWRHNATYLAQYFGKGDTVTVDGRLQTRSYVDKNNVKQNVVEIVGNMFMAVSSRQKTLAQVGIQPGQPVPESRGDSAAMVPVEVTAISGELSDADLAEAFAD